MIMNGKTRKTHQTLSNCTRLHTNCLETVVLKVKYQVVHFITKFCLIKRQKQEASQMHDGIRWGKDKGGGLLWGLVEVGGG